MAEGAFIALTDPPAKKDETYHDWYAGFVPMVMEIPGVLSGRRYSLAPDQIDTRPVNLFLTIFELDDVEAVRHRFAERFGLRTATEMLRLGEGVDQQTIMTTFFEKVSDKFAGPGPEVPLDQQSIVVSLLSVPLEIFPGFIAAYHENRLAERMTRPGVISGQLYQKSQHQVQNTIYPFIALYHSGQGQELLSTWPKPPTNWKSIAAARETDPSLRQGGALYNSANRDFLYVPYVRPEPPPPPAPKAAAPAAPKAPEA
ncbi:MAG: hypothetical protein ACYC5H_12645 [Methylovirgula sp.]